MNRKCSAATNIPKLARAICGSVGVCVREWSGACVSAVGLCVWWGVDVCWTALTVRPFQAYITEPSGLFPIATLAEVKGYVPLVCTPTVTAASASLCSSP